MLLCSVCLCVCFLRSLCSYVTITLLFYRLGVHEPGADIGKYLVVLFVCLVYVQYQFYTL